MERWTYRGVRVGVPWTADIPAPFRLGGDLDFIVQEILDDMDPWDEEGVSDTFEDFDLMRALVVSVEGRHRIWAKHVGHRARWVQESPFVRTNGEVPLTTQFTVMMMGTPEAPRLVRAYPGDFIPPLPWQHIDTPELWLRSLEFWRTHAYVYGPERVIPGSETETIPTWFSE